MAKFEPHATYTDDELLAITRAQIAEITTVGYSRSGDITLTKENLDSLWKQVAILEKRINAATRGRIAVNYVHFRRPGAASSVLEE